MTNSRKVKWTVRFTHIVLLVLLVSVFSYPQTLVSSESSGSISAAELSERMRKAFGAYAVDEPASSVELFKLTYASVDANGKPARLTGLVAWPSGGAPKGLVVYCHGTTVDRRRSPSRYKGQGEAPETVEAISAFATGGYAVVLPDYIGLGDHRAAHPYPLNKVNARSGVDIIPAVRSLALQKSYAMGPNLFVTGYSEGGGVAMALTQALQEKAGAEYKVTASAPSAGPYDLSGITREFMLFETGEQVGFILRVYLTSYAVNYLVNEKKLRWRDFYKLALANALAINYRRDPTDDGLIKNIGITTALMRAQNRLSNVLQPSFLSAMQRNDQRNAFVRMLRDNDVYDWSPRTRMLLIAIDGDTVVSQENTNKAYDTMRMRGVTNATLRRLIIKDSELNHLNGIAPAMSFARRFFDEGFEGVTEAR